MHQSTRNNYPPLLIAWEVTRTCNLNCKHCRASAKNKKYQNELTTEQCFRLLDNIALFSQPIIILTGGEPMLRPDIYQIARHGHELGLRMVMAPCGMLIDETSVRQIKDAGIQAISISLDGADAKSHDGFRQVEGAFDIALQACRIARENNLPFQINTTITKHNLDELPRMMALAEQLGAITFNPFLLVPTGRGQELADQEISPEEYENVLQWLSNQRGQTKMQLRVTCAPHYQRIIHQSKTIDNSPPKGHPHQNISGCMGGKSFAFVSHIGKVQICGFLETAAGDVTANDFNFKDIWENSEFLQQIRDVDSYDGKCGRCEYHNVCGGCRARTAAIQGNPFGSEPYCVYEPKLAK